MGRKVVVALMLSCVMSGVFADSADACGLFGRMRCRRAQRRSSSAPVQPAEAPASAGSIQDQIDDLNERVRILEQSQRQG